MASKGAARRAPDPPADGEKLDELLRRIGQLTRTVEPAEGRALVIEAEDALQPADLRQGVGDEPGRLGRIGMIELERGIGAEGDALPAMQERRCGSGAPGIAEPHQQEAGGGSGDVDEAPAGVNPVHRNASLVSAI